MEIPPLPQQIERRDTARLARYDEYQRRVAGTYRLTFGNRRQRVLQVNYAASVVEKVTAYLMTEHHPTVQANPDAEGGDVTAATRVLEQAWADNDLPLLDVETELDTATLGDGAFKVTWSEEEGRVVVSAPDPQGLFVWTAGDDGRRVYQVAQRWNMDPGDYAETYQEAPPEVSAPTRHTGFGGASAATETGSRDADRDASVTVIEAWTTEAVERWANGALVDHQANPYGVLPYVIYPNLPRPKHVWGISDIERIRPTLDEIDRLFTQHSRIAELAGNPIVVLEGVDDTENIVAQAGAMWTLPEDAKAYLLTLTKELGGGWGGEYFGQVMQALSDVAEVPRVAFGDVTGNLAAVSLQMILDPMLRRVDRKRLIRNGAFRRRNDLILRVAGHHLGVADLHEVLTDTTWEPFFDETPGRVPGLQPPPAPALRRGAATEEPDEPEQEEQAE